MPERTSRRPRKPSCGSFWTRLSRQLLTHTDLTERALLLYVAGSPVYGQPSPDEKSLIDQTLWTLLPKPTTAFKRGPNWVELTSTAELATWAFAHRNAPTPTQLRVVNTLEWLRYFKLPRGTLPALRIARGSYEPPSGDSQSGSRTRPTYLLQDGSMVQTGDHIEVGRMGGSSGPFGRSDDAGWKALAATLKLDAPTTRPDKGFFRLGG